MSDEARARDLRTQILRLTSQRAALLPDDICMNCGSRIFEEDREGWVHSNGSAWCEPTKAQPMAGRTILNPTGGA